MEMLVRLTKCKFLETGIFDDYVEALEHFFTEVIPRYQPHMKPWHDFRLEELWALEVNDLLHANLEPLRKLHTKLVIPGKAPRTVANYKDAMRFMTGKHPISIKPTLSPQDDPTTTGTNKANKGVSKPTFSPTSKASKLIDKQKGKSDAKEPADGDEMDEDGHDLKLKTDHITSNSFQLSEKQARYCYAMCKMTITHESTSGIKYYDMLVFVEFLELLGRIANIQFEGTPLQDEPLLLRLEYTLDTALAHIGKERCEPQAACIVEPSLASDDSY